MITIKAKITDKVGYWQHPETKEVFYPGSIVEIPEELFKSKIMDRVTPIKTEAEQPETPETPEKEEPEDAPETPDVTEEKIEVTPVEKVDSDDGPKTRNTKVEKKSRRR